MNISNEKTLLKCFVNYLGIKIPNMRLESFDQWFYIIQSGIASSVMLPIFLYHIIKSCKHLLKSKKKARINRPSKRDLFWLTTMHVCNYTTLSLLLLHTLIDLVSYILPLYINITNYCTIQSRIKVSIFHFSRFCMYITFITRLHIVYGKSYYGYSFKKTLLPIYIILILFIGSALFLDNIYYNSKWNNDTLSCKAKFPLWGVIISLVFDVLLSTVSIFLFAYPLFKLLKSMKVRETEIIGDQVKVIKSNTEDLIDHKFANILVKNSLLVSIAIISLQIVYIVVIISGIFLSNIDSLVVFICLVLMFKIHINAYNILCRNTCHKCCKIYFSAVFIHEPYSYDLDINVDHNNIEMITNDDTNEPSVVDKLINSPIIIKKRSLNSNQYQLVSAQSNSDRDIKSDIDHEMIINKNSSLQLINEDEYKE